MGITFAVNSQRRTTKWL